MAQQQGEPCPASPPLCPVPSAEVLALGRPGIHCWLGTRSLGSGPVLGGARSQGSGAGLERGASGPRCSPAVLLPMARSAAVPVLWAGEGRLQPPRPWLGPGTWVIVSSLGSARVPGEGPGEWEPLEPWPGIRGLGVGLCPQSTLA